MATVSFFNLLTGSSTPILAPLDVLPFIDVSDPTQSPNGSTVKATLAQFFAAVPSAVNVTSASANAFAVGRLGSTTTPAFTVDASTALQVAGLKVTGAVTGGTVAVVATDSGADTNVTFNAKGAGTIGIGSVSTGRVTITPVTTIAGALTLSSALTYGGVTLGNSVTGTGSMVLSASPTFTGTAVAASLTVNGTFTVAGTFSVPSLTVSTTLTLTGATVVGSPTWSSSQAITLSTASQPNITTLASALTTGTINGQTISSAAAFTGTVTVATSLGFGSTSSRSKLFIAASSTRPTGTFQMGIDNEVSFDSTALTFGAAYYSGAATQAAAFTMPIGAGFYADDWTKGAGSTITLMAGVYVAQQTVGATNYGIYVANNQSYFNGLVTVASGGLAVTGAATFDGLPTARTAASSDPLFSWLETGTDQWVAGIDVSDSHKFKINHGSSLGTSDQFQLTTAGALTLASSLTVTANGITVTAGGLNVNAGTTSVGNLTASSGGFTGVVNVPSNLGIKFGVLDTGIFSTGAGLLFLGDYAGGTKGVTINFTTGAVSMSASLAVSGAVSGVTTMALSGAITQTTGASDAIYTMNANTGSAARLMFQASGSNKWGLGRGVSAGANTFELYDLVNSSLAITVTAGAAPSVAFNGAVSGITTLSTSGALTYGGVTLSNAVTGTGNMVLSASPTLTGTLTATTITASGLVTASAGATVASGQTLTLTGATVAGTPTWSSSQAITLSTAAQPNITSVGTLTSLALGGAVTGATTIAASLRLMLGGIADPALNPDIGIGIANHSAFTPGTPVGGGYLFVASGALKYIGSSGTVTTIAPA